MNDTMNLGQDEMNRAIKMCAAIASTIKELKEVPSGHLYARVMDKMSLSQYQSIINILKRARVVKESNHLLTWIGGE